MSKEDIPKGLDSLFMMFTASEKLDEMPLQIFFENVSESRSMNVLKLSIKINYAMKQIIEADSKFSNMMTDDVIIALKVSSAKLLQAQNIVASQQDQEEFI